MTRGNGPTERSLAGEAPLLGLRVAFYVLVITYGVSTLQDMPQIVYAAKWVSLCLLAGTALLSARGNLQLRGMAVIAASLPWFVIALGYQIVIGPSPRGVGVAGSYLGLLTVAVVVLPSALVSLAQLDRMERWTIHAITVVTLVSVAMGVGNPAAAIVPSISGRAIRLRWGFEHVNDAGYLACLGLILASRQLLMRRYRFMVPAFLFLLILWAAGSRGAVATCAVGFATAGTLLAARRFGVGRVGLVLLACVTLGLGVSVSLYYRSFTEQSFYSVNRLSSGRLQGWREALGRLTSPVEWVFGKGAGQNINYVANKSAVGGSSDSFLIDLITRSGFLGLAMWLLTVVVLLSHLARRYHRSAKESRVAGLELAFAVGLAAAALAATSYEGFTFSIGTVFGIVTWSIVGIASLSENGWPTMNADAQGG